MRRTLAVVVAVFFVSLYLVAHEALKVDNMKHI